MKTSLLLFLFLPLLASAKVAGPGISGGGDQCENRIRSIAEDIGIWIQNGGAKALTLPPSLKIGQYENAMVREILRGKVSCVARGDRGYPVQINGTPKTCRFDQQGSESRITCDIEKFNSLGEENQYVLVHHEYAGLAGVEPANADESHYSISNQVSGYLERSIVKKLVVKRKAGFFCKNEIEAFVKASFPKDDESGAPFHSIRIEESYANDAAGELHADLHVLFDEDGFAAKRVFLGGELIYQDSTAVGCKNLLVKASFTDPLAE